MVKEFLRKGRTSFRVFSSGSLRYDSSGNFLMLVFWKMISEITTRAFLVSVKIFFGSTSTNPSEQPNSSLLSGVLREDRGENSLVHRP